MTRGKGRGMDGNGRNEEMSSSILHVSCFTLYAMLFLACHAEQGNYTAVSRKGEYICGIWKAHTANIAQKMLDNIAQKGVEGEQPIKPLPIITAVKPIELLPADGAFSDWVRLRKPTTYTSENLYKDVFGGEPELYRSYGFIEQANVEYQSPRLASYPLILVEIFDMGRPENAFGVYSFNRYPQDDFEWVGSKAIISGKKLCFWKGKYFVQIEGYELATEIKKGMIELARIIANHIKDPPTKPNLLKLLPQKNQAPNSEKYFLSGSSLRQIYRQLPENVTQLATDTLGVTSAYPHKSSPEDWIYTMVGFVIRYANESEAKVAYEAYRNYLQAHATGVTPIPTGGLVASEPQKERAKQ